MTPIIPLRGGPFIAVISRRCLSLAVAGFEERRVGGLALGLLAMVIATLGGGNEPSDEPDREPASTVEWRNRLIRLALALAAFALFVTLVPLLGFLASSMLLALACFLLAGASGRWVAVLALAVLLPFGLQLFFGNVTHTPFPPGSWGLVPTLN